MLRTLQIGEIGLVSGGMIKDDDFHFDTSGGGFYASEGWEQINWAACAALENGDICVVANSLNTAGAAGQVVGGIIAGAGLFTGPGEAGFGPIGGAIALAGAATQSAGYLIGSAAGCAP